MSKDLAEYCPGGTGKKIKHCLCRDIGSDLNAIMRSLAGNQRVAALERINRLLATNANRPCLLSLKAVTLMHMQDLQNLEETVATFLKVAPDNSLAHTYSAILEANKRNTKATVSAIQSALQHGEQSIPGELLDALEAAGHLLAQDGRYMAARAHLLLRVLMAHESEDAAKAYWEINSVEEVPLLLKRNVGFRAVRQDLPWAGELRRLVELGDRGCWKLALVGCEALNGQHPGMAVVLENIAVARTFLGHANSAEAWHAAGAAEDIEFDRAVLAEATAQLLEERKRDDDLVPVVKLTYELKDANEFLERLLSTPQAVRDQNEPSQARESDAPPPKAVFILLDRPPLQADVEPTLDVLPRAWGRLFLFGRETDRAARAEVYLARSSHFDAARQAFLDIAQEALLHDAVSEEKVGTARREVAEYTPNLFFTTKVPFSTRWRIIQSATLAAYQQRWPRMPLGALDGKTPEEVAEDPRYRVRLAAALLVLEQLCERRWLPLDVNALRRQLHVPEPGPIDPTQTDLTTVDPHQFHLVEVEKLADDLLADFQWHVVANAAHWASERVVTEILKREHLAVTLDMSEILGQLAQSVGDSERSLELLALARKWAERQRRSPARWFVAELPVRLLRGEADQATHLISLLQQRYAKEPGVMESLARILVQFGIITPDGRPAQDVSAAGPAAVEQGVAAESKIWTPDAPQSPGQPKQESKLWVPGMD